MKLYLIETDSDNPDDFTATKVTQVDVDLLLQAISVKIVSSADDLNNQRLADLEKKLQQCK